jgi:hypothetical protein
VRAIKRRLGAVHEHFRRTGTSAGRTFGYVTAALAVSIVLASCGSSANANFLAKADAICAAANAKVVALVPAKTLQEDVTFVKQSLKIALSTVNQLSRLKPPSDKQKDFEAAVGVEENEVQIEEGVLADVELGNVRSADALSVQLSEVGKPVGPDFRKIGLHECAVNAKPAGHPQRRSR